MKIIIPMAGLGSRFTAAGYKEHKPLIKVNNKSLIRYSVESLGIVGDFIFVCRDLGGSYIDELKSELQQCGISWTLKIINRVTTGAAETALIGLEDIHEDDELIITNCDQYLDWDGLKFLGEARKYDGAILTYNSTDPKNSFVSFIKNKVSNIVEKDPISNIALVGVHYWKSLEHFRSSAEALLHNFDNSRETYVSETYNTLIDSGLNIGAIPVEPGRYWSTGTPKDLEIFKGMIQEYHTPKPKTFFIDIDGTILNHAHEYSKLSDNPTLCPGIREAFDEMDMRGDKIILVSARKESSRPITEETLRKLMIPYDQLILGITQGQRIVINDKLTPNSPNRSGCYDVITDQGWTLKDVLDNTRN